MEALVLCVVLIVLLIRWRALSQRFAELERRIEFVSREPVSRHAFAELVQRVYRLEQAAAEPKPAPSPFLSPKPVATAPPAPPPEWATIPAAPPAPLPPERTETPVAPPAPVAHPRFEVPEPSRPGRSSEEWEALVGGNWLNKLGILVLVIAIALFLGYSFNHMGPAAVSSIALAMSAAILMGGVVLERRARYVTFARGLLGGGWAALYFTTYAMQALDAAKIIYNPVLGGFLLLAVAAGMVIHSLRYRSQAVTGLAYVVAFTTLAITPVTALSVIALVPLAASLLVVAYRFSWPRMVLFGLVATYCTCASRGDNGAPLWSAQTVFAAYWLLFEAYDILRARRRSSHAAEQAILPLNALGFAALSYAKWSAAAPEQTYLLASGIAAVYLASTVLRAALRPPASFPHETATLERIAAGGFEGPITLAAACSAVAAVLKLHGQTVNNVLLAEGELLFLAGLVFRQDYPRRLAGALFASLGVKLLSTDIPNAGTVQFAGRTLRDWTPSAGLASMLFYIDRGLRKAGRSYGYAASALLALVMGFEFSLRHLGVAWLGFAVLLFVFGWRFRLSDFRMQGYLAGILGLGAVGLHQAEMGSGTAPWIPLAIAAAVAYSAALCALRSSADRFTGRERQALQAIASAAASASSAALLWRTVPAVYLGPAWMALGILVLELGLRRWPSDYRIHAHILASLGAIRVLLLTILPLHPITLAGERIAIAATALLAYGFAARMLTASPDQAPADEMRSAINIASACGSLFVLIELWALLNPAAVAPAWTLFALLLMEVGLRAELPGVRWQGHLAAAAGFGRLFFANLEPGGYFLGLSHRVWSVAVVIASHCYAWFRQRDWKRPYLYTAAGLMAGLLYLEMRPPYIEAGWALLTLVLLVLGQLGDLRDLRFQSYGLAAITFARALSMELSSPEVFASTALRIVVGSVAITCLFAAQILSPRPSAKKGTGSHARFFYSLLTTVLTAALLFHEVSGSMLTVAWGIEGAVLLAAGFPLRDRIMRLSGLALFLICIGKLLLYDLRELETLYRIVSFFVLGVILVGVSWLYTRFRGLIQRYL